MNDQEKKQYLENYKQAKDKGVPFFPDIIFKDAVVALFIFLILVGLAYFIGAQLEPRANPADTSYTPRPEWYFLFLFQLLKYFPGNLEVLGVVIIPTAAILVLLSLPLLDRSKYRNFSKRPIVISITGLVSIAIIFLTIQAFLEAPPPAEAIAGDQTAALYTRNCAGCHGESITVKPGTNLHEVIAQGKHEDMPAWSADLTSDQIDALAGFILSPGGSKLFTDNCGSCHEVSALIAGNPIEIRNVIEEGPESAAHKVMEIPDSTKSLTQEQRVSLLNFLVAPDGQRLYAINCAPCHGQAIATSGDETELRKIISQGGLHLQMPPWHDKLSQTDLETLATYVVDPSSNAEGQKLFEQNCTSCHGKRIPKAEDVTQAMDAISQGGAHETMPVWGDILTEDQLDALVTYTLNAAKGTSTELGQQLFVTNCAPCHGEYGGGGVNPTRPGDIIPPISSLEYLKTRDDFTLNSIIAQGQPNFGMSPFSIANGGPLSDDDIKAIVAYMRSWEENPPMEFPPEVAETTPSASSSPTFVKDVKPIFDKKCIVCHGSLGGWNAASYDTVMSTGDSSPVVIPGDVENSLLAQKLLGTHTQGTIMPPTGKLPESELMTIINWISAGASES